MEKLELNKTYIVKKIGSNPIKIKILEVTEKTYLISLLDTNTTFRYLIDNFNFDFKLVEEQHYLELFEPKIKITII